MEGEVGTADGAGSFSRPETFRMNWTMYVWPALRLVVFGGLGALAWLDPVRFVLLGDMVFGEETSPEIARAAVADGLPFVVWLARVVGGFVGVRAALRLGWLARFSVTAEPGYVTIRQGLFPWDRSEFAYDESTLYDVRYRNTGLLNWTFRQGTIIFVGAEGDTQHQAFGQLARIRRAAAACALAIRPA